MSLGSVIVTGILADHYNMKAVEASTLNAEDYNDFYYVKPYSRIPPYYLESAVAGFFTVIGLTRKKRGL